MSPARTKGAASGASAAGGDDGAAGGSGGGVRLNLYLARCGEGSRRECDAIIQAGRVSVNGAVCLKPATRVSEGDEVLVDRRRVRPRSHLYLLLNKPPGFICTTKDERGRKTIYELLPPGWRRAGYAGRLDTDSQGLLFLTTDGALAQALSRPASKVEKEYDVTVDRPVTDETLEGLKKGTFIEGRRARAEAAWRTGPRRLRIILTQGIKRQIRVMLYRLGFEVRHLTRVRMGPLRLGALKQGAVRELTELEVAALREAVAGSGGRRRPGGRNAPDGRAAGR